MRFDKWHCHTNGTDSCVGQVPHEGMIPMTLPVSSGHDHEACVVLHCPARQGWSVLAHGEGAGHHSPRLKV